MGVPVMDKAEAIRNAQKFLAKGQIDKAIAEWESVAKSFPEGNTFNYLGDLYLKKGDKNGALETYHKAARVYMDEGFTLKALAIYKKVLNVNRADAYALIALGDLSEQKSIATDAIKYYLAAADVLSKENKKEDLIKVYDKIIRLAPDNLNLRLKMAEIFSKEGFTHEAANEYHNVGEKLLGAERYDQARQFLLKSVEIRPRSRKTLLALSTLSERTGDLNQAENYIATAIERTGEDEELLVRSAHLMVARGKINEAVAEIQKILKARPDSASAKKELAAIYDKSGQRQKAWEQYAMVVDSLASEGGTDEAISILKSYRDFDVSGNGRKLALIYKAAGRDEDAFGEYMAVYKAADGAGNKDEALAALKDAYEIAPYNTDVKEKIEAMEGLSLEEEPAALDSTLEEMPSIEVPEEGQYEEPSAAAPAVDEKAVDVQLAEADTFLKFGLYSDAKRILDKLKLSDPENIEVHLKLKKLFTDTADSEQAVTECIILSTIASRRGDAAKSKQFLAEAYGTNPEDPRLEGRITGEIKKLAQAGAPVEEDAGAVPSGFGAPAGGLEDISLDALVDASKVETPPEGGDYRNDVFDIFDEFKKGLEKEISSEDAETHYNLGIAYKEMGLIDDAIGEFQSTKTDSNFGVQSYTMLGICYKEKGLMPLAIESFKGALENVDPTDDTRWSIAYDLAETYEMNGEPAEAYKHYMDVYGWNAKYREVAARVDALKSEARPAAQAPPPPPPEPKPATQPPAPKPEEKKAAPAQPRDKKSRVSYL